MSSRIKAPHLGRGVTILTIAVCLSWAGFACAAPTLPPELQAKRLGAFAAGLQYLLNSQGPDGTWAGQDKSHLVGYTALPALTLMQGGISGHHPVIRQATAYIIQAVPKMENTYEISLSILFLDRLIYNEEGAGRKTEQGELARRLLKVLTLRLIAGQTITGGWGYTCKTITATEQARLLKELRRKHPRYLTAPASKGWAVLHNPAQLMEAPKHKRKLKKGVPPPPEKPPTFDSDNSVTQSAILALFAARRYHIPVERSFRLITKRFRTSQNSDGSWGYHYMRGGGDPPLATMVPAGLLGLALEYGLEDDDAPIRFTPSATGMANVMTALANPQWTTLLPALATAQRPANAALPTDKRANDPAIARGLIALANYIGQPTGRSENLPQPNLYFLWCLQRMGALYDLPTIGDRDWYRWGTEALLANQNVKGYWQNGGYPGTNPVIDTCFALLFLKQRDLVRDVVTKLDDDPDALAKLARVDHPKPAAPPVAQAAPAKPKPDTAKPTQVASKPSVPEPSQRTKSSESESRTAKRSTPPADVTPVTAPAEAESSNKLWLGLAVGGFALVLLVVAGLVLLLNRQPATAAIGRRRSSPKRNGRETRERNRAEPEARRSANGARNSDRPKRRPEQRRRVVDDEDE